MLGSYMNMCPPKLLYIDNDVITYTQKRMLLLCSLSPVQLFVTSWTAGLQTFLLSLLPRVCSNSCLLSQWCHPTISSSVTAFSCPWSFPASGSFPVSWLFESVGQTIGASASVHTMNIQGWFFLGFIELLSV